METVGIDHEFRIKRLRDRVNKACAEVCDIEKFLRSNLLYYPASLGELEWESRLVGPNDKPAWRIWCNDIPLAECPTDVRIIQYEPLTHLIEVVIAAGEAYFKVGIL